jgi:indolepyruvate ferredoxin oxidoreductase, beta subunit
MKRDIIFAGVGGQGIVTLSTIVGYAAVHRGLYIKQSEVHGMSQRGGDVSSHMRISDNVVYSALIPEGKADIIVSVEPMEALRYTSFLASDGWIVANKTPYINMANYPEAKTVWDTIEALPRSILIDAEKIAREVASARASNVVILGAASAHLEMTDEEIEDAIKTVFSRKGNPIVDANIRAFHAGKKFAEEHSNYQV